MSTTALKQGFAQFLKAHAALVPVIAGRVTPERIVQAADTRPALTYMLVSNDRPVTLEGVSSLAKARMQVKSWGGPDNGGPYGSASNLADLVRKCLSPTAAEKATYGNGFVGTISYLDATATPQTLVVSNCRPDDEQDIEDGPIVPQGADRALNCTSMDFFIWYQE